MLAVDMALETHMALKELRAEKSVPRKQRDTERRLQRKMDRVFSRIATLVTRELRDRDNLSDTVRRSVAERVMRYLDDFQEVLLSEAKEAAGWGRRRTLSSLQKSGLGISMTEEIMQLPDRTHELLRNHVFEASENTLRRLRGDVMGNLSMAYDEGLGIQDAAQRLHSDFDKMRDYQVERIARTEINSAQNIAAEETMEEYDVEFHQWWTSEDERVRDSHGLIHGEITRIGGAFSNGLKHPGDKSGPLEEWINCRCRIVPFIIPEGKQAPDTPTFYEADLVAA